MPAPIHRITPADVLPDAVYAAQRKARRATLLPMKRLRRIELGPVCTLHFESYDTLLFQVQEMLLVEGGGSAQLAEELAAYNPLIPQGSELVVTAMFEIDDPDRRAAFLARLGGVEERFFLQVGGDRIPGEPTGEAEPALDGERTSAVHFLRFLLADDQRLLFRDPTATIAVGCDHEAYAHMAMLSPAARAEVARDLA